MPSVLTIALQMALVPAISHAKAKMDKQTIRISAQVGTKLAIYLGLPCAVGLYVLAQPIISCLYSNLQPSSITTAAMLLQQMAPAIIFLALVQTLTGVLQGMGRVLYSSTASGSWGNRKGYTFVSVNTHTIY